MAKDRTRVLELAPRSRERLRESAGPVSGGEQQMLAIARALLTRPWLFAPRRALARSGAADGPADVAVTTSLLVEQNAHTARHGKIRRA